MIFSFLIVGFIENSLKTSAHLLKSARRPKNFLCWLEHPETDVNAEAESQEDAVAPPAGANRGYGMGSGRWRSRCTRGGASVGPGRRSFKAGPGPTQGAGAVHVEDRAKPSPGQRAWWGPLRLAPGSGAGQVRTTPCGVRGDGFVSGLSFAPVQL